MTGLGKSCSYIGALLFHVETVTKVRDNKTVTQEKAYWMIPLSYEEVLYKEIADIDFASPGSLRNKIVVDNGNPKNQEPKTYSKANYAKYLSARLKTKWFWVRILLLPLILCF